MDEKSGDEVFVNEQPGDSEQKPRKKRFSSVKSCYNQQISFEEQSSFESINNTLEDLFNGKRLVLMKTNLQIKELQTILYDQNTSRADFVFHADRLIHLVIEEGLNQLPFEECSVHTHSGVDYQGCTFYKGICGVSIVRSGEAMEKGLRECCRSVRIGKILMMKEEEDNSIRKIIYNRFPPDIHKRKVLLMYPLLLSGGNVILGVDALKDYGVTEENIYILTLFATPKSIHTLFEKHPGVLLLTTQIQNEVPLHFGEKYFGTDFH